MDGAGLDPSSLMTPSSLPPEILFDPSWLSACQSLLPLLIEENLGTGSQAAGADLANWTTALFEPHSGLGRVDYPAGRTQDVKVAQFVTPQEEEALYVAQLF